MTDPNEYYQEQQRRNFEQQQAQKAHGTLELVGLEKQSAQDRMARLQPYVVNALAVVGAIAIIYVILNILF